MKKFKDIDTATRLSDQIKEGEIIRIGINSKSDFQFSIEDKLVTPYRMARLKIFTPVKRVN